MRWRRIVLLSIGLLALLGLTTTIVLQRADAATAVLQRELQRWLRPTATLTSSEIDVAKGRLTARGLQLRDPTDPARTLLQVDAVHADITTRVGLLPFGLHAVRLDGVAIELGPQLPTLGDLLARTPEPGDDGGSQPLPALQVHDGQLRWTLRQGQPPLALRAFALRIAPRDDGHTLDVTASGELPEFGLRLQVGGAIDARDGSGELTLSTGELQLDDERLRRIATLAEARLPAGSLESRLTSLLVVAHLPKRSAAEASPWAEAELVLEHLRIRGGDWPALARDAAVTLQVDTRAGISAALRLVQNDDGGALEVIARGTDLQGACHIDVRGKGTELRFDEEVRRALNTFPIGAEIMRALAPSAGRGDLDIFLSEPHVKGAGFEEIDLRLRDVQLSYQGFGPPEKRAAFPLPLEHASGRVRLKDRIVLVEDVKAQIAASAGGGTVELHGYNEVKKPAGEDTWLDIHARDVRFTPALRTALGALLRDDGELYDRLRPEGRADVDVQVRPSQLLESCWAVEVRPRDAAMQWAGFPLRLDAVTGTVKARNDDVVFDLRGRHGDGRIALHGRLPIDSAKVDPLGFHAAVELTDLAIDDDLRAAVAVMAPELDAVWRSSQARGRLGGELRVLRQRVDDPLTIRASLQADDVAIALPAKPWHAHGLHGRVLLQNTGKDVRLDFDALRGQLGHGDRPSVPLAMLGQLAFGASATTDLAFVVRDLELDEQLGASLEEFGALGKGAWQSLRPSGRIDLVTRYEQAADAAGRLRLAVHLVDVASAAPMLPAPAEHMTGELSIADGELTFGEVRATMRGAAVRCTEGRVRTLPAPDLRTEVAFVVQANAVPVDDGLANLFTGPLQQAVRERHLRGSADIDGLRLRFLLPGSTGDPEFSTTLGGKLRLHDVDLTLGSGKDPIVVHGIDGRVTLQESTVVDGRGGIDGELHEVSLRLFNQPFTGLAGPFHADAERIALRDLVAGLHSGELRGRPAGTALEYLLPSPTLPDGRLMANLAFERVDVTAFLTACGWHNPPYSGTAQGELQLASLDGDEVVGARGSGGITIDRADLGVVPLFTAIYAQLPPADRPRFNHLDTRFVVENGAIRFDKLNVQSNVIGAKGKGTLGFDGYLDVEMTLDNLLGDSADPLLMPLIDYFAKNLVTFYLHGFLRDLRAEKRWVTESAPARLPSVPLPPFRVRPAAPGF